jgi:carboxyl-terminal processing protease
MRKLFVLMLLILLALCPLVKAQYPAASPEAVFDTLWQMFDQRYALFPAKSIDWQKLHDVYRPRIVTDMTEEELFVVLTDMLSHLNDNHVILVAQSLGRDFSAGYIGPYIEDMGLEGTLQFLQQHPLPGRYFKTAPRTLEEGVFQYGWIDRDVGYIHFTGFQAEVGNAVAMDSILKDFSSARSLIVDVRYNSGGDDRVGKIIADCFADKRRIYMVTRDRNGPGHNDFREPRYWHVNPASRTFTKPVILLTNRFSVSAAENFVLAMRVLPHVTVVGDFTSGCFADMAWFDLPNGWRCSYSRNYFVDYEGRCWEGIGVPPDIMIRGAEPEGDTDHAFEVALALLQNGGPSPQDESASAAAVRVSLVKILSRELENEDYAGAYKNYERIRRDLNPATSYLNARELNSLGYHLISQDRLEDALKVFKLYTENFPEDANAHDSLGEAYMLKGDNKRAKTSYRRSLELNPNNQNAVKMLSKLQNK